MLWTSLLIGSSTEGSLGSWLGGARGMELCKCVKMLRENKHFFDNTNKHAKISQIKTILKEWKKEFWMKLWIMSKPEKISKYFVHGKPINQCCLTIFCVSQN